MSPETARFPTLAGVVDGIARNRPDAPCFVCGSARLSFAEVAERVDRLAEGFRRLGVGPGDRVVWLGQNCHRLLESLLAVSKLGALLAPLNWRQSVAEFEFVLADLEPAVVLWQSLEGVDIDRLAAVTGPEVRWIAAEEDDGGYESLLEAPPARGPENRDPFLPVLILYTGAFTGRPSGSMLTSSNLLTQGMHLGHLMQLDREFVYLNCGPLAHIATLMVTVATLEYGGLNVVIPRSDPDLICDAIEQERCTSAFLLPQVAERVGARARETGADLSSFRSPIRELAGWSELVRPDETPWGRSSNGYGQTELSGNIAHGALLGEGPLPLGVGLPAPLMELAVRTDSGISGAPGATGEILVRGPLVHAGYWNRPEANIARFRDDWWNTGDLGRIGDDGRLIFIGPMARLIKSGLENIYPAEVEAAIRELDGVVEVGVIGIPDPTWVQAVRAVVVPAPGSALTEQDIVDHVASRIASYKKPRSVVFVADPLPRSGGFIDYDRLDEVHGGGGYPGASGRGN